MQNNVYMSERGHFVVVEGFNGSGKTTLLENLIPQLSSILTKQIQVTKEPTPNFHALLENQTEGNDLFDLVLLDRENHVKEVIEPNIANGVITVCDRYWLSSLVYQRMDGLKIKEIWSRNKGFPVPDLTLFLDCSEENQRERLNKRDRITRFENDQYILTERQFYYEGVDFLKSLGHNIITIDNSNGYLEYNIQLICTIINSILT